MQYWTPGSCSSTGWVGGGGGGGGCGCAGGCCVPVVLLFDMSEAERYAAREMETSSS